MSFCREHREYIGVCKICEMKQLYKTNSSYREEGEFGACERYVYCCDRCGAWFVNISKNWMQTGYDNKLKKWVLIDIG